MVDLPERLERLFPNDRIADFAQRWKVIELAVFGSVLRDDFNSDSDVDVLISFEPTATWSLWDLTRMKDDLAAISGRTIDLVEKDGLRNPFRRQHIVGGSKVIWSKPMC